MHPRVVAERRAAAETRLSAALGALADRSGLSVDYAPVVNRDPALRALYTLETMADVAEQLAGTKALEGTPQDPARNLTTDDLIAARVRAAAPRLDDNEVASVVAEVKRTDAPEPLQDRLVALPGIGDVTAGRILDAVGGIG